MNPTKKRLSDLERMAREGYIIQKSYVHRYPGPGWYERGGYIKPRPWWRRLLRRLGR